MAYTTINKSTDHFTTNLWTGAGATSKTISGNSFQPDWVWVKRRSATGSHKLYDAVRGTTKDLSSDNANPETTASGSGYLNAFNSDGFTLVQGSSDNYYVDANGVSYVAWNWKGGGTSVSNGDGSITSTVSANTTAGFSIVKYTGTGANATIGHGLGVAPKMIIVKAYEGGQQWAVQHSALGATKGIRLNTTGAAYTSSTRWNNTEPTSSVFTVGTEAEVNTNTEDHIAYCFAEKKGYSKFGKYVGNGNANGTFVYTGFKPAFTLIKRDATDNWAIHDNRRPGRNPNDAVLRSNLTDAEYGGSQGVDFLSNGFKARQNDGEFNADGNTYIYMAFGQTLVGSNNVPATAR